MASWSSKQIGITEDALIERNLQYFKNQTGSTNDHMAKLRLDDYEQRRRHKMRVLLLFMVDN